MSEHNPLPFYPSVCFTSRSLHLDCVHHQLPVVLVMSLLTTRYNSRFLALLDSVNTDTVVAHISFRPSVC